MRSAVPWPAGALPVTGRASAGPAPWRCGRGGGPAAVPGGRAYAYTPVAFAALAAATPEERLGHTMGAAELGRELGDAGGPLLVAGVATVTTLTGGFAALAAVTAAASAAAVRHRKREAAAVTADG